MVNPVGFRFRPTKEEIVDHYLRPTNFDGDTSHVDRNIMFMQDNHNDYRPPNSLTGVFSDCSSDDNDSDLLSPKTNSIETPSTWDSLAGSNRQIGLIKTQQSPDSTI
ncbi:unnamed protein product [Arabidopsis thaliana]|uniref:Uncharacterized protein n=1 Tax=Arabidopsis thaliana TaxID=3702 RepID=A0A5S9X8Z4_ARATH|nr:unnamed protein product [Arabidopsis thaliana]